MAASVVKCTNLDLLRLTLAAHLMTYCRQFAHRQIKPCKIAHLSISFLQGQKILFATDDKRIKYKAMGCFKGKLNVWHLLIINGLVLHQYHSLIIVFACHCANHPLCC